MKRIGFYALGFFVLVVGILAAGGAGAFAVDVTKLKGIEAIAGTVFLIVAPFITFMWSLTAAFHLFQSGDDLAASRPMNEDAR